MNEEQTEEGQPEPPSASVKFQIAPEQCHHDLRVTEIVDEKGGKHPFVALCISTVNGSQMFWFDPDQFAELMQDGQRAVMLIGQRMMAANPLVVANETQMKTALDKMNLTNIGLLRPPGSR